MAQVQVRDMKSSETNEFQILASEHDNKRKVNLCLGDQRYVSVFKNELCETVVNIRKGTRSVTINKDFFDQICNLKETILLCCAFTENNNSSG